jgi:hypothetical protein
MLGVLCAAYALPQSKPVCAQSCCTPGQRQRFVLPGKLRSVKSSKLRCPSITGQISRKTTCRNMQTGDAYSCEEKLAELDTVFKKSHPQFVISRNPTKEIGVGSDDSCEDYKLRQRKQSNCFDYSPYSSDKSKKNISTTSSSISSTTSALTAAHHARGLAVVHSRKLSATLGGSTSTHPGVRKLILKIYDIGINNTRKRRDDPNKRSGARQQLRLRS